MRLVISAIEGLTEADFTRAFARPKTAGVSHRRLADRTARELERRTRITRGLHQRLAESDLTPFGLTPQQQLERDLRGDSEPAPQSKTEQLQADVAAHQGWELDTPLHPADTQNVVNGWLSDTSGLLSDLYDSAFRDGQANFAEQYPHLFGGDTSKPPDDGSDPTDEDDEDKDAAMRNHFSSIAKMANEVMSLATVGQLLGWFDQNQRRVDMQAAQVAWAGEQHGYREAGAGKGLIIDWELDEGAEHCDDCPSLASGSPYTDEKGDNPLPTFPGSGDTACQGNCRCSLNYVEAATPEGQPTDDEDLSPDEAEAAVEAELGIDLDNFGGSMKGGLGGAAMWLQDALDGLDREVGVALDSKGHVLAAHVGTKDSVIFQREQLKRMRGAALSVHNHPGGQSFSPSDIAFAHAMRFGEIDVFSNRWTYTLRPQSGKFNPAIGKAVITRAEEVADDVLKDIEAKAHAGFAAQLKGEFKYGQPLVWPDYWKLETQDFWHQVWTKVAPEFKLDYKRLANPYYVAKPMPMVPKAIQPGIGYAPLPVPVDIIREEVPSAPKALGSLPQDFPKTFDEMANWPKVPGPSGSQEGFWVQGPNGKAYYVKPQVSLDRATNEIGTLLAYESMGAKAGLDIPFAGIVKNAAGKAYVVSQKMDFPITQHSASWWASPSGAAARAEAKKLWAADSLLSHYDVVGLANDNMFTHSMNAGVVRIEGGAGMKYRAQGAVKPGWSPNEPWDEPWTMRGKQHGESPASTQAASVFGSITNDEAADLLTQLKQTFTTAKLDALKAAWASIGMSSTQIDINASVIAARLTKIPAITFELKGGSQVYVPFKAQPTPVKTITVTPASGKLQPSSFVSWTGSVDDPLADKFVQNNLALFDDFWKTKAGYAGGAFHYTITKATPSHADKSLLQRAKLAFASWANTANDIILTGGADWNLLPPKLATWFKAHEAAFKAEPAPAAPKLPVWDKASDPIGAQFAQQHGAMFDDFMSSKLGYQGGAFNYAITSAIKAEGLEGDVATMAQKAQVAFARWYEQAAAGNYAGIPGKAAEWFKHKLIDVPESGAAVFTPKPVTAYSVPVAPVLPSKPDYQWSSTVLSSYTQDADAYFQDLQQSMGGYAAAKDEFIKKVAPQFEEAIANGHMTYAEALDAFQTVLGGDLGDLEEHINIVYGPGLSMEALEGHEVSAPVRVAAVPTLDDLKAYVAEHPDTFSLPSDNPSAPFGFYSDGALAKAWAAELAGTEKGWGPGFKEFLDYWKAKGMTPIEAALPESGLTVASLNAHFPDAAKTHEDWLPVLKTWQEWVGDNPYALEAIQIHSGDAAAYLKSIGIGVKDQLDAAIAKFEGGAPAAAQSVVAVAKTLPAQAELPTTMHFVLDDIKTSKGAGNFYVVPHGGGPAIILGHSAGISKDVALYRANTVASWQAKAPQLFTGMKRISFTGSKSYFKADQKVLIVSKTTFDSMDEAKFWHAMGLKLVDENPGWLDNFKAAMGGPVMTWQADNLAQSFSAYMAHPETLIQKVRDFWKAHLGVDTSAMPTFKTPLAVDIGKESTTGTPVAPSSIYQAAPDEAAFAAMQQHLINAGLGPFQDIAQFKEYHAHWLQGEGYIPDAVKDWFEKNMPKVGKFVAPTNDAWLKFQADGGNPFVPTGPEFKTAYEEWTKGEIDTTNPSSLKLKKWFDENMTAPAPSGWVTPKPITADNWMVAFPAADTTPTAMQEYIEKWIANGPDGMAITDAGLPKNVVTYLQSLNVQTIGDLKVAAAHLTQLAPDAQATLIGEWLKTPSSASGSTVATFNKLTALGLTPDEAAENMYAAAKAKGYGVHPAFTVEDFKNVLGIPPLEVEPIVPAHEIGMPPGLYKDFQQALPEFNWKPNTLAATWSDWLASAGSETTGNDILDKLFKSYLPTVVETPAAVEATGGVLPGPKTEPKGMEALKADALKWSEADDPDGSKFVNAHAGIWSEFKATKMGYKGGGFNWAVQTLTPDLPKGTSPKVRQQVALARLFKMYHEEPEKLKDIVPKVYKWLGNVIEGQSESAEVWSVSSAAAGVAPSSIATAKFEKLPVGWDSKAELQKTNAWMQTSMPSSRVVYDNWKAAAESKTTLNKWVRDLLGPAMKAEIDATGENGDAYYKLRGLAFTKSYLMAKAGYFDELGAISPQLREYWKDLLFPPPPRPLPPGRAPWASRLQMVNPGPSKRNALVTQIERDLQGHPAELERWRALQNGTASWKGGSQTSYHQAGERYVQGKTVNDSVGKGAAAMWDTIRDAPAAAPELGRSISWSGPQASIDYWKGLVGKTVDMQLAGFSDSGVDFAPQRNTRYVLSKGSQAFSTLAFTSGYEGEREWIVGGRFKITKVEKQGHRNYVYLEWVAPDRTGSSVLHERV